VRIVNANNNRNNVISVLADAHCFIFHTQTSSIIVHNNYKSVHCFINVYIFVADVDRVYLVDTCLNYYTKLF
jgi:hypothetical protein